MFSGDGFASNNHVKLPQTANRSEHFQNYDILVHHNIVNVLHQKSYMQAPLFVYRLRELTSVTVGYCFELFVFFKSYLLLLAYTISKQQGCQTERQKLPDIAIVSSHPVPFNPRKFFANNRCLLVNFSLILTGILHCHAQNYSQGQLKIAHNRNLFKLSMICCVNDLKKSYSDRLAVVVYNLVGGRNVRINNL